MEIKEIKTLVDTYRAAGRSREDTVDIVSAISINGEASEAFQYIDLKYKAALPDSFHLTDAGNAEHFAITYADKLRYDHRRSRWLEWHEHHWREDNTGQVMRLALKADRERYVSAFDVTDEKRKEALAKWLLQSEQRARLDSTLAIAKSLLPIADSGENWDSDPWLFCVANGVINLKTGEIRQGKAEDHITFASPVTFDRQSKAPRWELFLREIFDDNTPLIEWLQRYFGYSLTGITKEQVYVIGYGLGANGKGKLSLALRHIMGDYAYNAPFSTFELNTRSQIPNDMAALVGRRFVTSSEINEGTRFNEARMKALAGEDPITARFLHCEFFTFQPVAKYFLSVNYKPRVLDDTYGFWRKVRLVPFNRQFKGEADDKTLIEKLINEDSGILNWLIEGCLKWQNDALVPTPACVLEATGEYESESDPLAEFIADYCVITKQAQSKASDLYKNYKQWAEGQGIKEKEILSNTAFGRRMAQKFKKIKNRDGAFYQGVGLKCDGFVTGFETSITENEVDENIIHAREDNIENAITTRHTHENPSQENLELAPECPTAPCRNCGGTDFWLCDNEWRCKTCHPQPEKS